MAVLVAQLVIDSAEPRALARWWAEVLGWTVLEDDDEEVWVEPPPAGGIGPGGRGMGGLLFLPVPDAKHAKNRLHLDLRPADGSGQEAELERLLALGATRVDIGQGDVPWHVLADPEGNEFCLLRSTPTRLAELLAEQAG